MTFRKNVDSHLYDAEKNARTCLDTIWELKAASSHSQHFIGDERVLLFSLIFLDRFVEIQILYSLIGQEYLYYLCFRFTGFLRLCLFDRKDTQECLSRNSAHK
ncbi:hypothetical protein ACH5RR_037028 [Cinchona calisaya]|uniref:Uncharacterized protein n=1 Tax=Cinchona calisaya TaxID=153742 RepID=A0ABD2Y9D0_9GENT